MGLALVLHGGYCPLIGYLVYRSAVVPRFLGLLGECALMLWLLLMSTQESEPLAR